MLLRSDRLDIVLVMRYNIFMQDAHLPQSSGQLIRNSTAEFLIFTAQDGGESIEARYEDETVWLTQRLMAELFGTTRANVATRS